MAGRNLRAHELGAFLRSRRTLLDPGTAGVAVDGGVRRTPGLRRAELARLAGVSEGYYVRLEQGRAPHPSPSVLGALARALRLSDEEGGHLFALAGVPGPGEPAPGPAPLAESTRRMLGLLAPPTAAYVIDRRSDVLAWNGTAAALFSHLAEGPGPDGEPEAGRPESGSGCVRPNNVRYVFTDPGARELFVDWAEIASDSVAHLRASAGPHPDDPRLAALVTELTATSADFRRLWATRELRHKVDGRKYLRHPVAGPLTLDYVVLAAPLTDGQRLVAYTAEPGTPAYTSLKGLAP